MQPLHMFMLYNPFWMMTLLIPSESPPTLLFLSGRAVRKHKGVVPERLAGVLAGYNGIHIKPAGALKLKLPTTKFRGRRSRRLKIPDRWKRWWLTMILSSVLAAIE